ncbi:MAG: glycosyltransferase family 39 protein, partial [Anaerolineales bacterium]|nr:glycosyltransferase family 39 protein [Anaerolineales bacterium]
MGTRKFSNFVALLERNSRTIIAILVTLVILSGVVYSVYLGDALRFLPDEQDYFDLATNVAFQFLYSLDGENPTAYRPPGYPLFLSIFRYLGASVVILRILNFLFFGLGIYLVYKTLQKEYSPLAGLIGAFLLVAYPVVFFTSGTLYPQILASVLFLLIFYLYTRSSSHSWLYITCGVLFGFLILTIPTFIFVLFLFPVWLG